MKTIHSQRIPSLSLLFLAMILTFTGYKSCRNVKIVDSLTYNQGNISSSDKPPPKGNSGGKIVGITVLSIKKAPPHVRKIIDYLKSVRHMSPPKGFKGGRVFRNREEILPKGRKYYEFDVHPLREGVSRGAERLVTDQKKSVFYYTKDHYSTFTKIE